MYKNCYDEKEPQSKKKPIHQVSGCVTIWLDRNSPAIVFYKCFELYWVKYVTKITEHWTTQSVSDILLWSSFLNPKGLHTHNFFHATF